jgi:beta-glucosidase
VSSSLAGLQEKGIQSCLKHLVCNDSETSRRKYDVEVDDVTLREIYLRPFEMVIQQANPLAIMLAYNSIVRVRSQTLLAE